MGLLHLADILASEGINVDTALLSSAITTFGPSTKRQIFDVGSCRDSDLIGLRATLTSMLLIYGNALPFEGFPNSSVPLRPVRRFSLIPRALSNETGMRFVLSSPTESHTSISYGPHRRRMAEGPENLAARLHVSLKSNCQCKTLVTAVSTLLALRPATQRGVLCLASLAGESDSGRDA
ncbi:hypothetical protein LZ30DRAFT_772425 [Colletotrichum cereale]|nr:hypothetical protein LZ30DRAFT_772425 [Colletotrichum cereale]